MKVRNRIVEIYLLIMLGFYPIYMGQGYEELVYKKWALFRYASAAFVLVSVAVLIVTWVSERLSVMDWFMLAYLYCVTMSWINAADRESALWGVDTWYMGFVSQVLFVGIYFCISRSYVRKRYLEILSAVTAVIVSAIVIIQRFNIDFMHLYEGFGEDVKLDFVTTLGQVTWSSSYISILLIAGMGIYYMIEDNKMEKVHPFRQKIFWGGCIAIGCASEMVLNCDSGVIAIGCALLIMLWLAFGHRERVLRLTEIIIITLISSCVLGAFERIFAERMIPIDGIYLKTAQSPILYLLLALSVLFHFLIKKDKIHIIGKKRNIRIARGIYLALLLLGILAVAVLFVLHEKNYFNGSPTENYFRFTIWWGNSRGFIWRTGAAVFGDFNLWRKLFGCGPDGFTPYAYQLMGDAINEFWHNQIVPNVHNEWFNAVINYGLIGGGCYLGIFLTSAYQLMKAALHKAENSGIIFGAGLAAAGYIAHNVLCYQQIIGTPLIFILLGVGAAMKRTGTA